VAETSWVSTTDSGSSLVETVVGITLLGLVLVGVVDATWTNARVAATSRHRALAATLLDESLRTLDAVAYSPCPHVDGSYHVALESAMARIDSLHTADISHYEYWSESQSSWVTLTGLDPQFCSTSTDLIEPFAAQRLTVSIFGPHIQRTTQDESGPPEHTASSGGLSAVSTSVIVKTHEPQV
jgi:Tfp pilus assembly protein PilV